MVEEKKLTVDISPVKVGGVVRVHPDVKKDLDLEEGELAVVSSDIKDILAITYSDKFVEDGNIILREEDRKKLKVKKGGTVRIRKHESILKVKNIMNKLL